MTLQVQYKYQRKHAIIPLYGADYTYAHLYTSVVRRYKSVVNCNYSVRI